MHDTMMKRILAKLTNDELAERVMNEKLPQADRQAAMAECKARGLLKGLTRNVKKRRQSLL